MRKRVRVTVEFDLPQSATLTDCAEQVMRAMGTTKYAPTEDVEGCAYVRYDHTMLIVGAEIREQK